jgi:hypothetical protein
MMLLSIAIDTLLEVKATLPHLKQFWLLCEMLILL